MLLVLPVLVAAVERRRNLSTLWQLRALAWRVSAFVFQDLAAVPFVQLPAFALVLCSAAWLAYRVSINTPAATAA